LSDNRSFNRSLTNALDALRRCLRSVEDGCDQLESDIRLRHFDDAAHMALQIVKRLLVGSDAYRRIAAGLQDINAPASLLIPTKNRMNAARTMVTELLEWARTEEIEPKTRQLMDDIQTIISCDGICEGEG
jgi:hypothetical protein